MLYNITCVYEANNTPTFYSYIFDIGGNSLKKKKYTQVIQALSLAYKILKNIYLIIKIAKDVVD